MTKTRPVAQRLYSTPSSQEPSIYIPRIFFEKIRGEMPQINPEWTAYMNEVHKTKPINPYERLETLKIIEDGINALETIINDPELKAAVEEAEKKAAKQNFPLEYIR
jgi:hypothetical protein